MIPKSGTRFSEKIMRQRKKSQTPARQPAQNKTPAASAGVFERIVERAA
jgi:hypothetical protein